jgi:hypothetical protein
VFGRRRVHELENLVVLLRSEVSDLRSALREERAAFAAERIQLVDRLLARDAPHALREVRRQPPGESAEPRPTSDAAVGRARRFPGYMPDLRPPLPTFPQQTPVQLAALAEVATEPIEPSGVNDGA